MKAPNTNLQASSAAKAIEDKPEKLPFGSSRTAVWMFGILSLGICLTCAVKRLLKIWCLKFLWLVLHSFSDGGCLLFGAWSFVSPIAFVLLAFAADSQADTILASKHDLSSSGPGTIKASAESDVCGFCHTPHRGTGETPLWNHAMSSASYTPYGSSTTKATIGQPTGSSKLCLSCHDGTVALGMVASRSSAIQMANGVTTMPIGRSNLGTDLSDDHPISFTYNSTLVAANGELRDPSTLTAKVRLDPDQQMQCTSCHDPHDNRFGKFLVMDNNASALCVTCHTPNYWQDSSHKLSNKPWSGTGQNPWPHTSGSTVAANGCENCHAPHTAGTKPRLLNFANEEMNCFSCHAGTVATKDIQTEFNKFSVHPILNTTAVHDPMEDPINPPRHVECADCHNPHATRGTSATAPLASGALAGVKGVNTSGAVINPVVNEYELCFRCHADSVNRGPARVDRVYIQTNKRIQFSSSSQSFHPVASIGKNPNVPSLIPPLTTSSRMYCIDCHNNNQSPSTGNSGPNGPHGSIYTPILERQLVLQEGSVESFGNYALCYKCHDRNSILADQSFHAINSQGLDRGHRFHIVDVKAACSTCHDAHGVETQDRLINFDRTVVTNSVSTGQLKFQTTGTYSGSCTLSCHNFDHAPSTYPTVSLLPAIKSKGIIRKVK